MGIFDKFKKGLEKTRSFINDSFNRAKAHLGYFDEDMIDDLEMTLIQADCGIDCTTFLIDRVRQNIKDTGDYSAEAVAESLRSGMLEVLGDCEPIKLHDNCLNVILMIGVNGTGKTTTAGKLAKRYQEQGKRVIMCAADTFRAAAIEQLKVWGERSGVPVVAQAIGSDPAAVTYDALRAAEARRADVLIVDTAGRLHNKQNLMDELAKIRRVLGKGEVPVEIQALLTIDASTGQNALQQAKAFVKVTPIDGLVITKLDGNAKGGITLAVAKETKIAVRLAGLGEGIDDLQDFSANEFVNSLLPESLFSVE